MPEPNAARSRNEAILIFAPIGRDAEITARFLRQSALHCEICDSVEALKSALNHGCGVVLLTGEALTSEAIYILLPVLQQQPAWSDIPLVVLTSGGGENPANADVIAALGEAGNVTLIERPVRGGTLLSTIKSALRARNRQYDVRDLIAEESRAKEALRQSEERFRIALDAAHLGAWQLDLTTKSLNHTPTLATNYGLPPDTQCELDMLLAMIHPDDLALRQAAVERAVRERNSYTCEYRVTWPDGTPHWILVSGRANYGADGEPYSMIGVTLDITERKVAEQERERLLILEQEARSEAEAANRLKDEFLATVSHELRTPLTAILGWSNILNRGPLDAEIAASGLEIIERNARSQVQLIDDLLDVSSIISGKLRLHMQPIKIAPVINASMDAVRPTAEAKNVRLELSLAREAGFVSGDADRLQQVVWNLLTNAVKFTPEGGSVQASLECLDSCVEITVTDTGKGIDPEFLPHIFDRFRQADQTSTRRYGGLGLGLSIVRQLVELHGGTIQAKSQGEGQGAAFVVKLPLIADVKDSDESERSITADEPGEASQELPHLRILVVDDEQDTRDMLQAVLHQNGAEVVTAASCAEALNVIERWKPDLLVSDIGMPEEDGYALIEKLRGGMGLDTHAIPAIALTAYTREEDRSRALSVGFQAHLPKPVEVDELLAIVAQLTGRAD